MVRLKLGELLLEAKMLTAAQLQQALDAQTQFGGRLGTNLVELGFVREDALARLLATQHELPQVMAAELDDIPEDVIAALTPVQARKYCAVPFRLEGRELYLALASPGNLALLDQLRFDTGLRIRPHIAPELLLWSCLELYYEIERPKRYIDLEEGRRAGVAAEAQRKPEQAAPIELPPIEDLAGPEELEVEPELAVEAPLFASELEHTSDVLDPATYVQLLHDAPDPRRISELTVELAASYFERGVLFALGPGGYEPYMVFGMAPLALTLAVEPGALVELFRTNGFHYGALPGPLEGSGLRGRLSLAPTTPLFLAPIYRQERVELLLLGIRPLHGAGAEELRPVHFFLAKASLALQLQTLRRQLFELPA